MTELNSDRLNQIFTIIDREGDTDKSLSEILENAGEENPELYETISQILNNQENASNWFSSLSVRLEESLSSGQLLSVGQRLGAFQITDLMGKGGMAQVYLAERVDGEFEQKVAVKVLQKHITSDAYIELFKREKQILAKLNHPNIAQIFDGGILAEEQLPYFIMEYIDGESIDSYLARKAFPLHDRLELFIDIAEAVSFAHQNLIIHKDLKPQNIFIDKHGNIKLLDFGIAATFDKDSNVTTELQLATPRYASPELRLKKPVRTTSDIYQLGLVLRKMLLGRIEQAERKENDTFFDANALPDEVHAIISQATQENPEDRYGSVKEMITDVKNYLQKKPVAVYSDKAGYLIKKFVQRNKLTARISIAFLFLLVLVSVFYTLSLRKERKIAEKNYEKAQIEAARSKATVDYLKNIFYQADPFLAEGKTAPLDSVLIVAYNQLNDYMREQPGIKADIYLTMADLFRSTGNYTESHRAGFNALKILREEKPDADQLSKAYHEIASTHLYKDYNTDSALFYLNKAMTIDSADLSNSNIRLTYNYDLLGRVYGIKDNYDEAIKYYKLVLQRLEGMDDRETEVYRAGVNSMLGELYMKKSEFVKAEEILLSALETHEEYMGRENGYTINDMGKLAGLYHLTGKNKKAEKYNNKAIRLIKKVYDVNSTELEYPYYRAAMIAKSLGEYEKAIRYAQKAYTLCENHYGPDNYRTSQRLNTLGVVNLEAGKLSEALNFFTQSVKIKEENYPSATSSIHIGNYNIAKTLIKLDKPANAEKVLADVLQYEKEKYGEKHATIAITSGALAQALIDQDKKKQAGRLLESAWKIIEAKYDSTHIRRAEHLLVKAELYFKLSDYKKASAMAKQGMFIYDKKFNQSNWRFAFATSMYSLANYQITGDQQVVDNYYQGLNTLKKHLPKRSYYYKKLVGLAQENPLLTDAF